MTEQPKVAVKGVSHLALVCSDMARTVDFYEGVLGFPLIKTMELPRIRGGPLADGGQHFFFDIGNGDALAFFWWQNSPPAAPGVAFPTSVAGQSAIGSMHHIAFKIEPEEIERTAKLLDDNGIEWYGGAHPLMTAEWTAAMESIRPEQMAQKHLPGGMHYEEGQVTDETFAYSMYFTD